MAHGSGDRIKLAFRQHLPLPRRGGPGYLRFLILGFAPNGSVYAHIVTGSISAGRSFLAFLRSPVTQLGRCPLFLCLPDGLQ